MSTIIEKLFRTLSTVPLILLLTSLLPYDALSEEDPLVVQVGLRVHQITAINQKEENFTVVATLLMKWKNEKLSFEASEPPRAYQASTFISEMIEKKLLWPAVSFYNSQGRMAYQNRLVVVEPDGSVRYLARFTATFQAPDFDFKHFPLDQQNFSILIDSLRPKEQVRFIEMPNYSLMGDSLGEEEWIVEDVQTAITSHQEIGMDSSRFEFSFSGTRHLNYYILRILLPTVIIILVSWFTFFLKDYTKRIDLASGNLLLFIAFNFTIANDLPRLGYLTLMDTFLLATFVITGFVVLANVMLKRFHTNQQDQLIEKIDTFGVWGYPIFYAGAGILMFIIFYGSS